MEEMQATPTAGPCLCVLFLPRLIWDTHRPPLGKEAPVSLRYPHLVPHQEILGGGVEWTQCSGLSVHFLEVNPAILVGISLLCVSVCPSAKWVTSHICLMGVP